VRDIGELKVESGERRKNPMTDVRDIGELKVDSEIPTA
jgi:hypothetical protein